MLKKVVVYADRKGYQYPADIIEISGENVVVDNKDNGDLIVREKTGDTLAFFPKGQWFYWKKKE